MQDIFIRPSFFNNEIKGMTICQDCSAAVLLAGGVGEKRPPKKSTRTKKYKWKGKTMTSNVMLIRKMKRTMRYFSLGSIDDDNDADGEGSSSSMLFMIVTFINHHTSNLYHYTTLSPPTFLFDMTHTLFS